MAPLPKHRRLSARRAAGRRPGSPGLRKSSASPWSDLGSGGSEDVYSIWFMYNLYIYIYMIYNNRYYTYISLYLYFIIWIWICTVYEKMRVSIHDVFYVSKPTRKRGWRLSDGAHSLSVSVTTMGTTGRCKRHDMSNWKRTRFGASCISWVRVTFSSINPMTWICSRCSRDH